MENKDIENLYSDFVATVSHELRTPLTSIKGFAQTLLESSQQLNEMQKIKFLTIIKEQADRLIKLVENMLAVSKIYHENEILILKSVNLKSLIEKTVRIFKFQNQDKEIIFNYNEKLGNAYCDYDKTQQVMINLIENAIKYSPNKKEIIISCDFYDDKYISIKVTDFGVGIAKDNFEKIFEKFYRIDNHLISKTQGSGLGLYITKNLVEKMHGKIFVRSEEGKTEFEVLLQIENLEKQSSQKLQEV